MRPVLTLALLGCAAIALCGCLPLTIASALGMVAGGPGGPSAAGPNSPAFRESQWVKDKGPELFQATKATVLEACTAQIEAPTPASPGAETADGMASPGHACAYRKTCLPGNRVPVTLLVCGPDGRPPIQPHDGTGGTVQVSNWTWDEGAAAGPRPGED